SRDATRPTAAPLWTKNPSIHRGSTGRPSLRRDGHAPVAQPLPTPRPPRLRTSQPGWRTKGAKISPITSEKSPNREGVSAHRRGGLRVRLRSGGGGGAGGGSRYDREAHRPLAQPLPTPRPPSWRTSQPGWRTKGAKISPITSEKSPNREGVSANRRGGLRVRLRSVVGGGARDGSRYDDEARPADVA